MLQEFGWLRRLAVVVMTVMALGCAKSDPPPNVAKAKADAFYQALQQENFDEALNYCSPKRTEAEWLGILEHAREKLGTVTTVEFKRQEVNTTLRGRFFIFEYQVKYSGGTQAAETLTLFHKVDEEGTYIVSYKISADGYSSI